VSEEAAVLFLSSNQGDRHWLDIDLEQRRVRQALGESPFSSRIRFEVRTAVRSTDVAPALAGVEPAVVHFSGHGMKGGQLVLRDQEDRFVAAPVDAIARTLSSGGATRLVVLNACHSARLARALVASGVRFVVGTAGGIPDAAALAFSEVLYRSLSQGQSLARSFAYAKAAADLNLPDSGHLFSLDYAEGSDPAAWTLLATPAPGDDLQPVQALLMLDVYEDQEGRLSTLEELLPHERLVRHRLRMSDVAPWGPKLRHPVDPVQIDWPRLGGAVQTLYSVLQERLADNTAPVHFYVAGFAPLPLFTQLGFLLSGWSPRVTIFNWYRTANEWRSLPLRADPAAPAFFDVRGMETMNPASGRVALYVAAADRNVPEEAMSRFVRERGHSLAGVVSLTTGDELTEGNAAACASSLSEALSRLPTVFPNAQGVDLFVRGPSALAFCAGRAVNPNQIDLNVPNHSPRGYLSAIELPWRRAAAPPSLPGADAVQARQELLAEVTGRVRQLQSEMGTAQIRLPSGLAVAPDEAARLVATLAGQLRESGVRAGTDEDVFRFDAKRAELRFGHRLLDALGQASDEARRRIVSLLVFNGLYHRAEGLDSCYGALGPATRILDEVDAWADAFAALVQVSREIDEGGHDALERCGGIVREILGAHLDALVLFDRISHGERIRALTERRLGRYLVGALQRARAASVVEPDQIAGLLGDRLTVALAPLETRVGLQGGREVVQPSSQARLYVAVNGRMRHVTTPPLVEPGGLVEAVKQGELATLVAAMKVVVEQNAAVLTPWAS